MKKILLSPFFYVINLFKAYRKKIETTAENTKINDVRSTFVLVERFSGLVIMHGGHVIYEFKPSNTISEVIKVVEKYRQLATNGMLTKD